MSITLNTYGIRSINAASFNGTLSAKDKPIEYIPLSIRDFANTILRINNLTIGYNFNSVLNKITWMSNLKLYMAVNNLYTFTDYNGMDPEVRFSGTSPEASGNHPQGWASGIDLGLYPQARTVMFGLSADF